MLLEQLERRWRRQSGDIQTKPCFKAHGLVLGADTLLASAEREPNSEVADQRLRTLLCLAYGRPAAETALPHLRRATQSYRQGQHARADVHLALSGLGSMRAPNESARRLFIADGLMRRGVTPQALLKTLGVSAGRLPLDPAYLSEPRLPDGAPGAGEWTQGGSAPDQRAPAAKPAASAKPRPSPAPQSPASAKPVSSPPSHAGASRDRSQLRHGLNR